MSSNQLTDSVAETPARWPGADGKSGASRPRYVRAEAAERESITATLGAWNRIPGLARE